MLCPSRAPGELKGSAETACPACRPGEGGHPQTAPCTPGSHCWDPACLAPSDAKCVGSTSGGQWSQRWRGLPEATGSQED